MTPVLDAPIRQLFTTIPVDEPKFLWVCSGYDAVGVYHLAPVDYGQCGTKDVSPSNNQVVISY